jgi:hypothetical protein
MNGDVPSTLTIILRYLRLPNLKQQTQRNLYMISDEKEGRSSFPDNLSLRPLTLCISFYQPTSPLGTRRRRGSLIAHQHGATSR